MSDLSVRARALAVREGLNSKVETLADLHQALGDYGKLRGPKEWARVLFDVAVLSAMIGIDVVDGVQAAIEQREVSGRKVFPGTKAPVPNAMTNDGTMRDPGTGQEPWPDEA
jgi:hypothetical protein